MFRGLTSLQLFVDDVAEAERWYVDVLGMEPPAPRTRGSLPGMSGSASGITRASSVSPTASSRPTAWEPARLAPSPTGRSTTWSPPSTGCSLWGATALQPPTELSGGFMIASVVDPFGNALGLRFDPNFLKDR